MKEGAAYQAAAAGQQTVESGTSASMPHIETPVEKPRAKAKAVAAPGLAFPRFFTEAGVDPFDEVEWELRAAVIGNERGEVVFEQRDVEIPGAWGGPDAPHNSNTPFCLPVLTQHRGSD